MKVLISYDTYFQINLEFDSDSTLACDSNAFVNNWQRYGLKLREFYGELGLSGWTEDIDNFLLLLQLFPSKINQLATMEASKKLIVFRVVRFCFRVWFEQNF